MFPLIVAGAVAGARQQQNKIAGARQGVINALSGSQGGGQLYAPGTQNQQSLLGALIGRYRSGTQPNPTSTTTLPNACGTGMGGQGGVVNTPNGNATVLNPSVAPSSPPPPAPPPLGGGVLGSGADPDVSDTYASGSIVTRPTKALIGERGPEMVVPLTPRSQNRIQPDVFEGHITPPKVPGMRYSRYKSYTDRSL